jgi:NADH:ubiquinone oxidoreductase subunit F (NADH-binding)
MTRVERVLPTTPITGLDDYRRGGGGEAVAAARRVEPEVVVAEIEASGLRGRGGAGFPTGTKWRTIAANRSADADLPATVVVNAAEGEPGTYKDRAIIRANPYAVIEGALIAAHAVGAADVVVALKEGEATEHDRVARAIAEMDAAGLLGDTPVALVTGPRHYLFGEETALLEAVDGRPPFPRIAPPYRRGVVEVVEDDADVDSDSGASGHVEMAGPGSATVAPPALVDNVETLANVPAIIRRGAAWFREVGTEASPGTIVCTVTGDVRHPAVAEIALGTTLRAAIEEVAGGAASEHRVKAVLNGVSAAPLPAALLDTPLTWEDMAAAGSALGTSSLIVLGADTDMTAVAAGVARFLAVESCGQCTPCKSDGLAISDALGRLCGGTTPATEAAGDAGGAHDLDAVAKALTTVADGARCNLASQQQAVVGGILAAWGDELAARAAGPAEPVEPVLIAEITSLVDGSVAVDEGRRAKQPDWTTDPDWSGASPADRA